MPLNHRSLWILVVVALMATTLLYCLDVFAAEGGTPQEEVQEIDAEIDRLTDQKDRAEASASRHDDEGMRWQFMQNEKQESKQAYQRAERDRQTARSLQKQIEALQERRAEIIKAHPEVDG